MTAPAARSDAAPASLGAPARRRARTRNHPMVRVTHWVAAVAIVGMTGSGLQIFNAHPRFGARGGPPFPLWPFEGTPAPRWATFGGWLAGGRW